MCPPPAPCATKTHDVTKYNEAALTRYRRDHVGFVFQFYNLIPSLTARENVALVTDIARDPMPAAEALKLVGLVDRMDHFPPQMSGGEQQSAAVVTPGTALLELGNPTDLEMEVDVLSTDAVQIEPGAPVHIERWGGDAPLNGIVRIVEPQAFTKVSALGVEEQRVNIIIDFGDPPDKWKALGDGYRIEARIVTWHDDDVLKAPAGALFRQGTQWALFVVRDGKAAVPPATPGRRTMLEVQINDGRSAGDTVIVHPSDEVTDGAVVAPRP